MIIPLLARQLDLNTVREYVQGNIVDNKDPLNKSRVRVSITGISDSIPVKYLPWYPVLHEGSNSKIKVPPVNTRVLIKYNTIYNSIVLGTIPSTTPT